MQDADKGLIKDICDLQDSGPLERKDTAWQNEHLLLFQYTCLSWAQRGDVDPCEIHKFSLSG